MSEIKNVWFHYVLRVSAWHKYLLIFWVEQYRTVYPCPNPRHCNRIYLATKEDELSVLKVQQHSQGYLRLFTRVKVLMSETLHTEVNRNNMGTGLKDAVCL